MKSILLLLAICPLFCSCNQHSEEEQQNHKVGGLTEKHYTPNGHVNSKKYTISISLFDLN